MHDTLAVTPTYINHHGIFLRAFEAELLFARCPSCHPVVSVKALNIWWLCGHFTNNVVCFSSLRARNSVWSRSIFLLRRHCRTSCDVSSLPNMASAITFEPRLRCFLPRYHAVTVMALIDLWITLNWKYTQSHRSVMFIMWNFDNFRNLTSNCLCLSDVST